MIRLSGIEKSFGANRIFAGVDLIVAPGRVTALIGPSGSGKSTLLRCVNLLEIPEAGRLEIDQLSVQFDGKRRLPPADILAVRRSTGMVFQNFQLFPHRRAIENVTEGLTTVLKWPADRARARGMELLESVGMVGKADAYPATLSGGQQQRVAIARALAASPKVLLCDEPTSALDPELAAEVVEVLGRLASGGTTMLMATHDLRLAGRIAHHVAFLQGGEVVEAGPPQEVLRAPKDERTARFVRTLTVTAAGF
ncbi:amino acid ABC transporter ATP-binding protein [Aureimonas psammosilenae]|uniref:amino acid ABC transporter ATP-binding protein n=1 Tax=Aureimonas psammosilenae TaxID=2495496 RepID=UPI001260556D|nr:amino acid ABC transporter ATP-binding protein [Aureimonas psammosilenae]